MVSLPTFGLPAPLARFLRAIASSAVAAGMVALLASIEDVKSIVVDAVKGIPGLSVNSETTISFIAVAVVLAVVYASAPA